MKISTHTTLFFISLIIISLLVSQSNGDARTQVIKYTCDGAFSENRTQFIENFVRATTITSNEIRTRHISTVTLGSGPNKVYLLTQCFQDLSSQDCIICYSQLRTYSPNCYPGGGRVYLDGCFMRLENYNFFEEYTSPNDTTVCANTTQKSVLFQESTSQAVANAVTGALRNSDYFAREEMLVLGSNDSVYVLAECWETLSPSSCRACLENASMLIAKCLPWSEGRVLNTGCFMRYSDTNFLNPIPATSRSSNSNRGRIIAIVVSVFSSVVVLAVALVMVLYITKRRYIQRRRNGIIISILYYNARNEQTNDWIKIFRFL
ncbi:cysteine-rich receptor-like protein kinase 2 [Bidens hawaiensis]|uniref:cysteine-rich receptor-like protein kinase 2 n=1 Tax=Bidens hawaiensis TaxID=980011 RepID=UPI00404B544D